MHWSEVFKWSEYWHYWGGSAWAENQCDNGYWIVYYIVYYMLMLRLKYTVIDSMTIREYYRI